MQIETKDFGTLEIDENDILSFPNGIYGFEDIKEFVVLKNSDNKWLMHLQSINGANPRFLIVDPYMFFADYKPNLPEEALELLKAKSREKLSFFCIAVIPANPGESTVNLRSPIVINFEAKIGAQVILDNKEYSVRTTLFNRSVTAKEKK